MSRGIKQIIESEVNDRIALVRTFETERAFNAYKHYLDGFLDALMQTNFIDYEDKNYYMNKYNDDTLGYVKKK